MTNYARHSKNLSPSYIYTFYIDEVRPSEIINRAVQIILINARV